MLALVQQRGTSARMQPCAAASSSPCSYLLTHSRRANVAASCTALRRGDCSMRVQTWAKSILELLMSRMQ